MQPGTLLAERYRLESVIATGGMGVVYAATDLATGRSSAIKVLKPELLKEPRFVERLRREAKAASSLAHPNIVEITDLLIERDRAFLVMERLEGEPWGVAISNSANGMPVADVVHIGRQLLSALDAAHHAGLVHRDVKPDNVFLAREPSGATRVKLLDFGLVKLEAADRLTASHSVLGTWQYMAPEQARGERTDGRADVYSVGACLYYALTKKRPYQAADAEAATFALSEEPAPPLRSMRADVPPALAAVIERALAKDVTRRWRTAREMHDAFAPWSRRPSATPRIEPDEDDDILTNPVRRGTRPAAAAPAARIVNAPVKRDVTSEDLVEVASEIGDADAADTARVEAPPAELVETDPEIQTTRREPASRKAPDRAAAALPSIEPESVLLPAPTIAVADPGPFRRSAPSRHRWRPPQKVRAMPLVLPPIEVPEGERRRPPAWLLVALGFALFASGLALGRVLLG